LSTLVHVVSPLESACRNKKLYIKTGKGNFLKLRLGRVKNYNRFFV
jgi:hypothetical protein